MSDDDKKTGSSTYHIEKLNETNYRSWAQQMTWILDEKDLLEVVNGTDVKPLAPTPEEVTDAGTSSPVSPAMTVNTGISMFCAT